MRPPAKSSHIVALQGRILGASAEEMSAASEAVVQALGSEVMKRAHARPPAACANARCWSHWRTAPWPRVSPTSPSKSRLMARAAGRWWTSKPTPKSGGICRDIARSWKFICEESPAAPALKPAASCCGYDVSVTPASVPVPFIRPGSRVAPAEKLLIISLGGSLARGGSHHTPDRRWRSARRMPAHEMVVEEEVTVFSNERNFIGCGLWVAAKRPWPAHGAPQRQKPPGCA